MWIFIKYFFITCFLSIATACYLLGATPAGLKYDLQWLATKLPGKLTIRKIDGTLLSGFTLQNVSYQTPDTHISFKLVDIRWNPLLLLKGQCDISELTIKNGRIILPDNKQQDTHTPFLTWWHHITLHHVIIEHLYVEQSTSVIQLEGDLTDKWNLQWKLAKLDIKKWFPDYQGLLDSEGTLEGELSKPTLHAVFHLKNVLFHKLFMSALNGKADITLNPSRTHSSVSFTAIDTTLSDHHYKKLTLTASGDTTFEKQNLQAIVNINIENIALLSAHITLPDYSSVKNAKQKIDALITLHPMKINLFSHTDSYLRNLHGNLSGKLTMQGLLLKPILTGEFALNHAGFSIPTLGIHPDILSAQGTLTKNHQITLHSSIQSGSGKAQLTGNIDLNLPNFPFTMALRGEHLSIVQLSEYKIIINPDIHIQLIYPLLQLTGTITVPSADIKPKNLSGTTTLPEEVVFVQQKKTKPTSSLNTSLDIHVILGDKINVDYEHLQAALKGNLHITKETDAAAIAQGEFYTTQGKYKAYGQNLVIESGRLIYTGNALTNPGLDIKASKKIRGVVNNNPNDYTTNNPAIPLYESLKVGVQINGTVKKPIISLFSVPGDLTQTDILSYLLIGQPQSNVSSHQGVALLSLLTSLNPNGTKIGHLTEKLQDTLGLTEFNIESVQNFNPYSNSVESTTSFVIGKQITKKLSLHYSIGLFDPVSVLNLRYQINDHWALQSETSTADNGADLLYVFERD